VSSGSHHDDRIFGKSGPTGEENPEAWEIREKMQEAPILIWSRSIWVSKGNSMLS